MNTIFSGKGSPWHVCLHINSLINPIDLQVFISSRNTHNFVSSNVCPLFNAYCLNSASFFAILIASGIAISFMNLMISSSLVPAWMFNVFIFVLSPLFLSSDNFLISEVFPQPVSPIIITGIPDRNLNNTNIILTKLSGVIT